MKNDVQTTTAESSGLPVRTALRVGETSCSLTWIQGDLAALEAGLALEETVCRWDLREIMSTLGYCITG